MDESKKVTKRKVKSNLSIKYKISLNEEQKEGKRLILENKITIITGQAGSGKSQLAIAVAIDLLFKNEIEKIFITRPIVTREEIGFLPGTIEEKLDPFLIPIYDCLRSLYNEEKIKDLFRNKIIEIAPIAYMRGRSFTNSVLIIDECQNISLESLKMCLTRLGKNSKIILTGDAAQIDLQSTRQSCINFLVTLAKKINGFCWVNLLENHRDPIIFEILEEFKKFEQSNELKLYDKS